MRLLLPLILGLIGLGAGVGAAMFLPSDAPEEDKTVSEHSLTEAPHDCPPPSTEAEAVPPPRLDSNTLEDRDYVKLDDQFIIPVVNENHVAALVIMSLTIETKLGQSEIVYTREPKLRDLFLQALLDHASTGRFMGDFATAANLSPLRQELMVIARRVLGEDVSNVLITDIARQDT